MNKEIEELERIFRQTMERSDRDKKIARDIAYMKMYPMISSTEMDAALTQGTQIPQVAPPWACGPGQVLT